MRIELCLLLLFYEANCIPIESFFPFGASAGDEVQDREISLSPPLPFLGEVKNSLSVSSSGRISLYGDGYIEYYDHYYPYNSYIDIFSTYLNSSIGTISHNSVLDNNKMNRITQLIQESFGYSFVPTGVFTATWNGVPYAYSGTDLRNTFQCVLTTNGQDTFVFFLYADGLIRYSDRSVYIGIRGDDRVDYYTYTVPNSYTPDIVRTSNVNQPGLWVFKVDKYNIIGDVPDVAPSLRLTEFVGHSDFVIEWTFYDEITDNNKADSFLITYASSNTVINVSYNINFTRERVYFVYQITGLQENTDYTCFLTARNIFGDGPSSNIINVTTKSVIDDTTKFVIDIDNETESADKRQFASPAVVGGVIGNIVLLVLVMVIMISVICKRKRKPRGQEMKERAHVDETPMDVAQLQAQDMHEQEMEMPVYEEIAGTPAGYDTPEHGTPTEHGTPAELAGQDEYGTPAGQAGLGMPAGQPAKCGPAYINTSFSPPKLHQTSAEEKAPPLPSKPTAGTGAAMTPVHHVTPVTSGSEGIYMPLSTPQIPQQDHYMSLCNTTRRQVTTTGACVDV